MKETTTQKHRNIHDIFKELINHPDYVYGSYWKKGDIIDDIIVAISDNYKDSDGIDPQIIIDADEIYNKNEIIIHNNINNAFDYVYQHLDILEDCDLTIKKNN